MVDMFASLWRSPVAGVRSFSRAICSVLSSTASAAVFSSDAGNAFGAGDWGMSSLAVAIPKLGLDEAAPDRVAREFDAVPHAELLEHVRAVAVDGLDADDEHGRDFF
jgi:hypothetical protein